jgi:hypothetical protein
MRASLQLSLRFLYDADDLSITAYFDFTIYSKFFSCFYKNGCNTIVTYVRGLLKVIFGHAGFLPVFLGDKIASEAGIFFIHRSKLYFSKQGMKILIAISAHTKR